MAVKLPVSSFKKMIDSCKRVTAKNDARPDLRNINIDVTGNKLRIWALDGYRIEINEMFVQDEDNFKASFESIYVPTNEQEVQISIVDEQLEITYIPSGLRMYIPQDNKDKVFNIDGFIEGQKEKDFKISFKKQFLEDALKKAGKNDKLTFGFNPKSNLEAVHITYTDREINMESYVLPVRS